MSREEIQEYIKENEGFLFETLRDLCLIPAPSGKEEKRAAFCKKWLEKIGAKGVYIDDALNVIFPLNCEGKKNITVFCAHTDTVFPDTRPMPYLDEGENIFCPGVGDDTASVAVLLFLAKYFVEKKILPQEGYLFVCNSSEEGLGNLLGTRQLFADFEGRIGRFISFDSNLNVINDVCVGSRRYEVEVRTKGGHSFQDFGVPNGIFHLSRIVSEIYRIKVPQKKSARTTYNVGEIAGGTSVNTIAQSAKMLCEYRSEDKEALSFMEKRFSQIFEGAKKDGVKVIVKKVGDRPCGGAEPEKVSELVEILRCEIEDVIEEKVITKSASTDCNIPLSLGIPAACMGVFFGGGSHTREEWIEKASLPKGLEAAIRVSLALMK